MVCMKESNFSKKYVVRKLRKEDISQIYELCSRNSLYYQYCPPFVSYESIQKDMTALPPGVTFENKHYVGYFGGDKLVAILDLIDGYPGRDTAFIGFFICDVSVQKNGIGTDIITELIEYLGKLGYSSVRLAWVKGNPQAEHFWTKNKFVMIKETTSTAANCVILAERNLNK